MQDILDLDTFPLDRPGSADWQGLVADAIARLEADGLFNLPGFVRPGALSRALAQLKPALRDDSFRHERRHNIYFQPRIGGLAPDHPALTQFETSNQTVCADQMDGNPVLALYDWPPFAAFLAAVMQRPALYPMADPLARVNVMSYGDGQALGWHFDRSEFTTTLLLQAPEAGGAFEYDTDLRSDTDPNYDGVADLLAGRRRPHQLRLDPGTLNIFKGKNTAHRVTPTQGPSERIIAVFSYFDRPGVTFTPAERIGFYGRAS